MMERVNSRDVEAEQIAERDKHLAVLERLFESEGGTLDRFDGRLVVLLRDVIGPHNKESGVLDAVKEAALKSRVVSALASILGGGAGGVLGGKLGAAYVAARTSEGLTRFAGERIDPVFEGASSGVAEQLQGLHKTAGGFLQKLMADSDGFFSGIAGYWNRGVSGAKEGIQHSVQAVQEGITGRIDALHDTVNQQVVVPVVEHVSHFAGEVARYPAMAIGAMIGGALVGGTMAGFREVAGNSGIDRLVPVMEAAQRMIETGEKEEGTEDPRVTLIALFEKIADDPTRRMGHTNMKGEDWTLFAATVRQARVSLLREKSKGPVVRATPELRDALKEQERVVERIIEAQEGIAEADMEMAQEILAQFDASLAKDTEPEKRRLAKYGKKSAQAKATIMAVARGALDGSGLPLLARAVGSLSRGVWKARRLAGIP